MLSPFILSFSLNLFAKRSSSKKDVCLYIKAITRSRRYKDNTFPRNPHTYTTCAPFFIPSVLRHQNNPSEKYSTKCNTFGERERCAKMPYEVSNERAMGGRKILASYRFLATGTADTFIPAQYYTSYSDMIAAVDRAALEVAMQINAGSIERDCPERVSAKESEG